MAEDFKVWLVSSENTEWCGVKTDIAVKTPLDWEEDDDRITDNLKFIYAVEEEMRDMLDEDDIDEDEGILFNSEVAEWDFANFGDVDAQQWAQVIDLTE